MVNVAGTFVATVTAAAVGNAAVAIAACGDDDACFAAVAAAVAVYFAIPPLGYESKVSL